MLSRKIATFQEVYNSRLLVRESVGSAILNKLPVFLINLLRRYAVKYLKALQVSKPEAFETLYSMYKDNDIDSLKNLALQQINSNAIKTENFNTKKLIIGGLGAAVSLLSAIGMSIKAWMHYTPDNLPNISTAEIIADVFVTLIILALPLVTGSVIDNYRDKEEALQYIEDLEQENNNLNNALDKLKSKEETNNKTDLELER